METTVDKMNKKLVDQLNELVEINNDRIQGYETAAKETDDTELKNLFRGMASHSMEYKKELSEEVIRLGGEPKQGTTSSGKIFRAWMDIKAALTAKDRKAVISSCETGEDAALEKYDSVLTSDDLTGTFKSVIARQRSEIQRDHDAIKGLRDAAKVAQ